MEEHRTGDQNERDGFLDAVRAIAVVRVVLWHTLAAAVITYLFAAVPAIVFVSSSLLVRSLARRGTHAVLADRFRRLLVPYWAYMLAVTVGLAVCAAAGAKQALPGWGAVTWLAPLVDPAPVGFEHGWLTSALWYVRLMCWVLLAVPLLARACRRHVKMTATGLAVVLVASQVFGSNLASGSLAGRLWWYVGDAGMFGLFALAGVLHGQGWFDFVQTRIFLATGAVFAMASVAVVAVAPPLGMVANNSHIVHFLVGGFWLCAALSSQGTLRRLAAAPWAAPVIAFVNRRSLTIYLTHSAVIVVTYRLVDHFSITGLFKAPLAVVLVFAGTLAACVLVGGVEDLAAKRTVRLWPVGDASSQRTTAAALASSVVVTLMVAAAALPQPAVSSLAQITAPSRQPFAAFQKDAKIAEIVALPIQDSTTQPAVAPVFADAELSSQLQVLADRYLADTAISGVAVTVEKPSSLTYGFSAGEAPATSFRTWSVTKMFITAALFQMSEQGLVVLDEPLPTLAALRNGWKLDGVTWRQLLSHHVRLGDYHAFVDAGEDITQAALIDRVLDASDVTVGDTAEYNSTGFLIAAEALSQLAGMPWGQVLSTRIFTPLGLTDTFVADGRAGDNSFGSGGVVSTTADLAAFATALLRDVRVVSLSSLRQMAAFDATGLGTGLFGTCPCSTTLDGEHVFFALGHPGAMTRVMYAPSLDVVVSLQLTSSQWTEDWLPGRTEQLVADLAQALAGWVARQGGARLPQPNAELVRTAAAFDFGSGGDQSAPGSVPAAELADDQQR